MEKPADRAQGPWPGGPCPAPPEQVPGQGERTQPPGATPPGTAGGTPGPSTATSPTLPLGDGLGGLAGEDRQLPTLPPRPGAGRCCSTDLHRGGGEAGGPITRSNSSRVPPLPEEEAAGQRPGVRAVPGGTGPWGRPDGQVVLLVGPPLEGGGGGRPSIRAHRSRRWSSRASPGLWRGHGDLTSTSGRWAAKARRGLGQEAGADGQAGPMVSLPTWSQWRSSRSRS